MQPTWNSELNRYFPRLKKLPVVISTALSELYSLGVTAPCDPSTDIRTIILTQLVLFNIGSLRVAHDLSEAADALFRDGKITSTCLQLRFLFELWGATSFSSALCRKVRDSDDFGDVETLQKIVTPIGRLISGSRIPIELPRGGKSTTKSFNVMTFIQHLEKCEPGTKQEYYFLCEACHPSFVQQSHFWMAGSVGDNWTNQKFQKHAHELLERLISAGEKAAAGLSEATGSVTKVSRPLITSS